MSPLGPHRKHSPRFPCPVCAGTDTYCLTFEDGWTNCGRVESAKPGGLGWFHWTGEGVPAPRQSWRDRLPPPAPPRATPAISPAMRDQVFGAWAEAAGLTPDDRQHLRRRGFSDDTIDANGYASHPAGRAPRRRIAETLLARFGAETMEQIPGFYYRAERGGDPAPTLAGAPGILIPVRDPQRYIQAFQVRAHTDDPKRRYTWVSSNPDDPDNPRPGGTSSGSPLHVAYAGDEGPGAPVDAIFLTEGPLKGDYLAARQGVTTIALAGVASQQALPATISQLGARHVAIAFDADAETNRHVLPQRDKAAATLSALGCNVQLVTWPTSPGPDGTPTPKGVDDACQAGIPLAMSPYPFPRRHRIIEIPAETVPPRPPRALHTLDEARNAHQQAISDLIARASPGVTCISSPPGSGKTHAVARAAASLRALRRWPRVTDRKGGERRARIVYLTQTKEQVAEFVALTGGQATAVEGRNPDPGHPWGCHRPLLIRRAGEGRHNPAAEVCRACREEHEAAFGTGWLCHYLQSKSAAEGQDLVAAPLGSFLNASDEIEQFDIVIVDEGMTASLIERVILTPARADEWLNRMDVLAGEASSHGRWGINDPFRRLMNLLKLAIAQHDPMAHDWQPATAALSTIDAAFPALIAELAQIAPSKKSGHYDFERPVSGATEAEALFPLRATRDLIAAFAAELERPAGADVRCWLTPKGVQLVLPRQHLIDRLRRKTVINLDATPPPLLRWLFPDMQTVELPVPGALHVTQIKDTLATQDRLSGAENPLRDRLAAAIDAVTRDADKPVIFGHKSLIESRHDAGPRIAVSNPRVQLGWFDNQTRGLNRFSDTDCLVIVGRYSQPISDLRAQVQAVRWAEIPPAPAASDEQLVPYLYRAPDGAGLARWTKSDPDPDVAAMTRWSEASTVIQAIGRGRAALRDASAPLRVFLFTNQPIAGVPIDRMTTLAELGASPPQRGVNPDFRAAQVRRQAINTTVASVNERAVARAVVALQDRGEVVTMTAVARESGISRKTLYSRPVLRAMIEQANEPPQRITSGVTPGSSHRYIRDDPGVTVQVIDPVPAVRVPATRIFRPHPALSTIVSGTGG